MDSIPQRKCKTCQETLPLTSEFWHKDKTNKQGFSYACKECAKARARKWGADNKEYANQQARDYYAENKETIVKDYRERNKEHIAEIKRDYRKRNPEQTKKNKSASQKRNRPAANARTKRSQQRHPEVRRAATMTRIARKHAAPGKYTGADIKRMYDEQEGMCMYCGIRLYLDIPKDVHVDHIVPLTKGGSNYPDNLHLTCAECNQSKNNHDFADWFIMRGW